MNLQALEKLKELNSPEVREAVRKENEKRRLEALKEEAAEYPKESILQVLATDEGVLDLRGWGQNWGRDWKPEDIDIRKCLEGWWEARIERAEPNNGFFAVGQTGFFAFGNGGHAEWLLQRFWKVHGGTLEELYQAIMAVKDRHFLYHGKHWCAEGRMYVGWLARKGQEWGDEFSQYDRRKPHAFKATGQDLEKVRSEVEGDIKMVRWYFDEGNKYLRMLGLHEERTPTILAKPADAVICWGISQHIRLLLKEKRVIEARLKWADKRKVDVVSGWDPYNGVHKGAVPRNLHFSSGSGWREHYLGHYFDRKAETERLAEVRAELEIDFKKIKFVKANGSLLAFVNFNAINKVKELAAAKKAASGMPETKPETKYECIECGFRTLKELNDCRDCSDELED